MKKLIGFAVVLVVLFLSNNVFAQDRLIVSVDRGFFGCSGPKHYEVASKDEINNKDGTLGFTWEEAKTACENSTVDGKTHWFLPSKEVLKAMYEQLHEKGVGGFVNASYWSSSEDNGYTAYGRDFDDGKQNYYFKDSNIRVRCVRAI